MDRRTVLTGTAAALIGATAVGRALLRGAGDEPVRESAPRTAPPSPGEPSPVDPPTVEPSAQPAEPPSPPPSPALVVPVLCREAWGARPPGDGLVPHELRRMTVHHSAVALPDNRAAPDRFRRHQHHHQAQGWPDIAYHLGVDRAGNVYELRPTGARSDTFTDYDPTGHLSLLAEGDFERQQPSDAQLEGLARVLAWGATELGLPLDTVSGHREHAHTACPGDALQARLPELRRQAADLAAAGGVVTRSLCGREGAARVAEITSGDA